MAITMNRIRRLAIFIAAVCAIVYIFILKIILPTNMFAYPNLKSNGKPYPTNLHKGAGAQAIYVHSAIFDRISNSLVIYYIASCVNKQQLAVRLIRSDGTIVYLTGTKQPSNHGCPWNYARTCTWGGFLWTADNSFHLEKEDVQNMAMQIKLLPPERSSGNSNEHTEKPWVESEWTGGTQVLLNPPASQTEPGTMAVCMQPAFFLSDWPVVVRFVELWKAAGVVREIRQPIDGSQFQK